ncbi:MAG: lysophospholipase L1-like esterase [Verrucomicrobiales bacterium]|jgi:lysophospholipase L1-like esterase
MRTFQLLTAFLALHVLASDALAQLRVYPVGDSITWGTTAAGGYRSPLYQKLTAVGYEVDMVGSVKDFADKVLRDAGEEHHDGHSGWTILQIDRQIERWLELFEAPDVILIHIGTNDFRNGTSNTRAIVQLDNLMTKIALATPTSHMIVTNLLERGGSANTQIQADFNPFVEEKIAGQVALGRKVSFLDMRAAVPLSDMPDQLHPNKAGLIKMADAYFGAIRLVAGPPSPFKVTSFDVSEKDGGSEVTLTWNSRAERTYVVQTADDPNEWTDLQFSIPTGGTTTTQTIEIPAGVDGRYIRIREGLPAANLLSETNVQWSVPTDASHEATWNATAAPDGAGFVSGEGLGIGFETRPGTFDPFIDTHVLDEMLLINSTIYLRYGFALPADHNYTTLEYGMRYDDGFVAYLNGTEIASRNAPDVGGWDAKATAGHIDSKAVEFEEIDVSEFLSLLLPGEDNVLAIQGMNKTTSGSDFLMEPRLTGEFEGGQ